MQQWAARLPRQGEGRQAELPDNGAVEARLPAVARGSKGQPHIMYSIELYKTYTYGLVFSHTDPIPISDARTDMSENAMKKVAEGNAAAMQEIFESYAGLVRSIARRMRLRSADVEDAVQEIFIEVWRCADRFDETKGSAKLFIATIARRRLIDRIRKEVRQPQLAPAEELDDARWAEPGTAGETLAEAERVARVVARLRPVRRRVLSMGLLEGMTHTEISHATGMPLGTVKTQMRRGLMQVREWIQATPMRTPEAIGSQLA